MDLLKIKKEAERKGIKISSIAKNIGMSVQNLHRCIRDGRIEAGHLEKIAKILDVPIFYFFDDETNRPVIPDKDRDKYTSVAESKTIYERTCTACQDKEKIITLLEEKIKLLEEKLENLE